MKFSKKYYMILFIIILSNFALAEICETGWTETVGDPMLNVSQFISIDIEDCPTSIIYMPVCYPEENDFMNLANTPFHASMNINETAYIGEKVNVEISVKNNDIFSHSISKIMCGEADGDCLNLQFTLYENEYNITDYSINFGDIVYNGLVPVPLFAVNFNPNVSSLITPTNIVFEEGSDCDLNFNYPLDCQIAPGEIVKVLFNWTAIQGNLTARVWQKQTGNECFLDADEKKIFVNGSQSAEGNCPIYLTGYGELSGQIVSIGHENPNGIDDVYYSGAESEPQVIRNFRDDLKLNYRVIGKDYGFFSFIGITKETQQTNLDQLFATPFQVLFGESILPTLTQLITSEAPTRNIIIETIDLPINHEVIYDFNFDFDKSILNVDVGTPNDYFQYTFNINDPEFNGEYLAKSGFSIWKFVLDENSFENLFFDTTDSDGVPDMADKCKNSESGDVDEVGCTINEFCSLIDVTKTGNIRNCMFADWNEDEENNPKDCKISVNKGLMECVPFESNH